MGRGQRALRYVAACLLASSASAPSYMQLDSTSCSGRDELGTSTVSSTAECQALCDAAYQACSKVESCLASSRDSARAPTTATIPA